MLDRDRNSATWHNYSNDFRWQKPVFPRPESFLLNLSLNILSRLFSSHTLTQNSQTSFLKDGTRKLSKLVFTAPLSSYVKHQNCTFVKRLYRLPLYIHKCTTLSAHYDTFPNHLIRQTISTLLQRIEIRDINPVFTWYLPYIFIFTPIPNASVIKVLTLSIIFPYLYPLSHFPPRYPP